MNKVLIPAPRSKNRFFEEIETHSVHTEYVYGTIDSDITGYDAILIHWPEQLFNWREPNQTQMDHLKSRITTWKKSLPILHVIHNLSPHRLESNTIQELYKLIIDSSDVLIHFGNYSRELFEKKYPGSNNRVLPHPLYHASMKIYDRITARQKFKIAPKDVVVVVPGRIRTFQERKTVLSSFKSIKNRSKTLLVPSMIDHNINQLKGYYFLKKILPIDRIHDYFYYKKYSSKYVLQSGYVENDLLSQMMSAADMVLVPRLSNLNSGIIYLALTYKKMVVGPDNGNSSEILKRHGMELFDPQNPEDIKRAINKASQRLSSFEMDDSDIAYLASGQTAGQWDQLFDDTLRLS